MDKYLTLFLVLISLSCFTILLFNHAKENYNTDKENTPISAKYRGHRYVRYKQRRAKGQDNPNM